MSKTILLTCMFFYFCTFLLQSFFLQTETANAAGIPGFDFTLSEESYWEFYWSYEKVSFAQGSNPTTSTDTGNFRLELDPPITINGITAYPLTAVGKTSDPEFDYKPRWNYIALHNGQLLGSVDGDSFTIILNANTGQWQGGGFFTTFPSDSQIHVTNGFIDNEYTQTSAQVVGRSLSQDKCEWYGGIQVCPNDESYTISEKEYYKGGIGPLGYFYFFSYSNDGGGFYTSLQRTRHLGLVATSHIAVDGFIPHLPPWTEVASLPQPRSGHSSTVANGKIYVFGGYLEGHTGSYATSSALVYDPALNVWSSVKSMPQASSGHSSQFHNGIIYVFGGDLTNVQAYNPVTNYWYSKVSLPSEISNEDITSASMGSYFLSFTNNETQVPTYVVEDNQWYYVTPMPIAHYWPGACSSADRSYVLGGYEVGYNWSAVSQATCLEFNPYEPYGSSNAWKFCSGMPTARSNVACNFFEGKIFAIGGFDNGKYLRTVEAYNPKTKTWSVEKSLNKERKSHSTAVANGRLYVIGGEKGSQKLNSVEMFTPPDTDSDGLSDYVEQNVYCLNFQDSDSDDDGLADGIEDKNHDGFRGSMETDPCNPDSDGDGFGDGVEDANHNGIVDPGESDPLIPDSDSDADGVADTIDSCLRYDNSLDADGDGIPDCIDHGDSDSDGFTDAEEASCGSDPASQNSKCAILTPWLMLLLD